MAVAAAYQIPYFRPEHLLVLEVLPFEATDMALHLEGGICDRGGPGRDKAPPKAGTHEQPVLAGRKDEVCFQEELLP